MKYIELEKEYKPSDFEDRIYEQWKSSGAFKPKDSPSGSASGTGGGTGEAGGSEAGSGEKTYTIVIPPPNVTGILHVGHALNITLQDIAIRFHRMLGETVLWIPGTDHAGIATQNVVEKRLREKGITRRDLGREKFIEETWKVKDEHHAVISRQIAKMGASVDWSRERFTMDEGLAKAVREVFVSLYERGLLYKGKYLVNWCPSCGTALSDDEVEHEDLQGAMYHIRYPLQDGSGFAEIATTRPETLLGDTALAVNPDDPRYTKIVGKKVKLPLTDREIPIVADSYVDKEFGTGIVKITPAHDPNDWELGKRQNLPVINILNPDGTLNSEVPAKYQGLSVKKARKIILEDLESGGFFIKKQEITHSVGHCYRCHSIIEPFLSEQWFVKMKPLAQKALAAWQDGGVVFYPKKWENTYKHWLENIRDWCISRQLWWGHRIPAWSCPQCGATTVSRTEISACPSCGGAVLQDEDVLDTWFSSWLWPFSTLGWQGESGGGSAPLASNPPKGGFSATPPALRAEDLRRFYPTTALVTAYDIIFFWVSRMIMAGMEFTGVPPFKDIYIHGLLRDKQGRKMSKTLGNGIDPLEIVDEYGADALKFTLAFLCAQGQDILLDKESFKIGSKFVNKIWNASRYILMNMEGGDFIKDPQLCAADKWIYARLAASAASVTESLLAYRYNEAANLVYEFFWNDFCDWYVECSKLSINDSGSDRAEKNRALSILLDVLSQTLCLLHPFVPFVTEEIYSKLPKEITNGGMLILQNYPCAKIPGDAAQTEEDFSFLQEIVKAIRTLRSECIIANDKKLRVTLNAGKKYTAFIRGNKPLICLLAGLSALDIADEPEQNNKTPPHGSIGIAGTGFDAFVFIADAVDISSLKTKWENGAEKDKKYLNALKAKLSNDNFIKNAPPELIELEKQKLLQTETRINKINMYLQTLE